MDDDAKVTIAAVLAVLFFAVGLLPLAFIMFALACKFDS